jgi:hypothetical protein
MRRAYPASLCFQELIEIISEGFFTASQTAKDAAPRTSTASTKSNFKSPEKGAATRQYKCPQNVSYKRNVQWL